VAAKRMRTGGKPAAASVPVAIAQVVLIDVVFSIDSIVTAVGMAQDIRIMIAAVLIAVAIMYVASGAVAAFIAHHPTTKMLALAFLVLIGVALLADGFGIHFPRGYIYFAMAFAAVVEGMNVLVHRRRRRARRGGG
jgi:predicted tellurium resistance membrane protein TerC